MGFAHTNWDNFQTRWSGYPKMVGIVQMMGELRKNCKRAPKREENKVAQSWNRNDEQDGKSEQEKERRT